MSRQLQYNKKKILLLGGSHAQIPVIKRARKKGLFTILCDYLPDNPGQEIADKYIIASTTDKESILRIAQDLEVDSIMAYASDPAAPTAAYVSEKLGLPGNSYESVKKLTQKHLFRQLLIDIGLNCPNVIMFKKGEIISSNKIGIEYPLIIKPVDSSGSKGVKIAHSFSELQSAADYALSFSKTKKIIVEEFINSSQGDIHGDGFVINGKLKFKFLGNHLYDNKEHPFNPTGTLWPTTLPYNYQKELEMQINKILSNVGFLNGAVNIEARVTDEGRVYVMEIGPRNGGHFIPQLIEYSTGFDMVNAGIDLALGKDIYLPSITKKYSAYYAVNTCDAGILKEFVISSQLEEYMIDFYQYINVGDSVNGFDGANKAIGVALLRFGSREEMMSITKNIKEYFIITIE